VEQSCGADQTSGGELSKFDPERDGWALGEAVMRTGLPGLHAAVRSCMQELRARGVLFDGPHSWNENLAPPAGSDTWPERSDEELKNDILRFLIGAVETTFRHKLYGGTLVSWGRPGSSLADYKRAPPWAVRGIVSWWEGGGILRLQSGELFYAARVEQIHTIEKRFSISELRAYLHEHHAKRRQSGKPPTERDDYDAARLKFPGVSRDAVRKERREIMGSDLLRRGRRPATGK
jgi:hypothetical protein